MGHRGKLKLVLSDLHLGAGQVEQGNALEDFFCDREFAALLSQTADESRRAGAEAELILNGDLFEMLQVPHVAEFEPARVYPPESYHSSAEPDALLKMKLIVRGHPEFFAAMRSFLRARKPRRCVTFVRGNHDLELFWPAVQQEIRLAMAATGRRAGLLAFEPWHVDREEIYVEHGNQYGEALSRLDSMVDALDPRRPGQLRSPPGARLVVDLFNRIERDRYWIDGIKPVTALVWYALAFDFRFAARALASLLRAVPGLLEEMVTTARERRLDLLRQLEDPERAGEIAARYQASAPFRDWIDDEADDVLLPAGTPEPQDAPDAGGRSAVARGDLARHQVRSSLYRAAARLAAERSAQLVCFGHTHEPGREALPGGATYLNCGTWTWKADLGGAGKETWRELFQHPERFRSDHQLTYVRIDYDGDGRPVGSLRTFEAQPLPSSKAGKLRSMVQDLIEWSERWLRATLGRLGR